MKHREGLEETDNGLYPKGHNFRYSKTKARALFIQALIVGIFDPDSSRTIKNTVIHIAVKCSAKEMPGIRTVKINAITKSILGNLNEIP